MAGKRNHTGGEDTGTSGKRPLSLTETIFGTLFFFLILPLVIDGLLRWAAAAAGLSAEDFSSLNACVGEGVSLVFVLLRFRSLPGAAGDPAFPRAFPEERLSVRGVFRIVILAWFGFDAANGAAQILYAAFFGGGLSGLSFGSGEASSTVGTYLVWSVVSYVIVSPVFEETMIRGFLYRGLRQYLGFFPAAALSSFLWAAAHIHFKTVVLTFLAGFIFALVYEKYRKLWIPILIHMVNNFLALDQIRSVIASRTSSAGTRIVLFVLAVEAAVSVYLFFRIAKDGGGKEKML